MNQLEFVKVINIKERKGREGKEEKEGRKEGRQTSKINERKTFISFYLTYNFIFMATVKVGVFWKKISP